MHHMCSMLSRDEGSTVSPLTAGRPRHPSCQSTYLGQAASRIDVPLLTACEPWLAAELHLTCLQMREAVFSQLENELRFKLNQGSV